MPQVKHGAQGFAMAFGGGATLSLGHPPAPDGEGAESPGQGDGGVATPPRPAGWSRQTKGAQVTGQYRRAPSGGCPISCTDNERVTSHRLAPRGDVP